MRVCVRVLSVYVICPGECDMYICVVLAEVLANGWPSETTIIASPPPAIQTSGIVCVYTGFHTTILVWNLGWVLAIPCVAEAVVAAALPSSLCACRLSILLEPAPSSSCV